MDSEILLRTFGPLEDQPSESYLIPYQSLALV
jgi:hypothetical protein